MKIEITYKSAILEITNYKSNTEENGADLVISEIGETTNKSIIEFRRGENKSLITVFWSHFSNDASLCVHFSEEENVLFLGGGNLSAVINMSSLEIINIFYPDLFWAWEYIQGHVLELGELECRLYTPGGLLVGAAPVDPPYEYKANVTAIEFSSIVVGKTSIEFGHG